MEDNSNVQYGGAKQLSVFTILVYMLTIGVCGYFAWKYTEKFDNTKRYLIVAASVLGGYIVMYLLRSMTFNL